MIPGTILGIQDCSYLSAVAQCCLPCCRLLNDNALVTRKELWFLGDLGQVRSRKEELQICEKKCWLVITDPELFPLAANCDHLTEASCATNLAMTGYRQLLCVTNLKSSPVSLTLTRVQCKS